MSKQAPFDTATRIQRCLVVHPFTPSQQQGRSASAELEEAVGLTSAIHLEIVEALLFTLKRATPRTLIGSGQVAQCRDLAEANDVDVIIINAQLSPTQQRNLETATKCKVIDRTALILEIFGERAQTSEGRLQVELAALNYQKSRLVRSWTHLERQRGGAGFMGGPGETQIETDRRLIAERLQVIKKQLKKVVQTRELHRKTRRETPLPIVALVGYTNAGKSTLFNTLTKSKVMAEDMLFATLDPTIRAITLPSGQKVLLSDTVGFISNLPHELVAAFRATLEEVLEADILLHVRDISHSDTEAQAADVYHVLTELIGEEAIEDRPMIEVWNKIDLAPSKQMPAAASDRNVCLTSAVTGEGLSALLASVEAQLVASYYIERKYTLSSSDGRSLSWLHTHGTVIDIKQKDSTAEVTVRMRAEDIQRYEKQIAPQSA